MSTSDSLSSMATVFRMFRIARLFRLVRFLKGLNRLFFAFILSIPKLFNVGVVMFLLIYLYAVLGYIVAPVRLVSGCQGSISISERSCYPLGSSADPLINKP